MPQSDGKNTLKRMEFVYGNKSFKFTLNPEEYTQEEPTRSTVTQTKNGAWIDDFGSGLPTITMRGTTGVKKGGFAKFVQFRNFIRDYMQSGTFGQERTEELIFYNYTDEESWVVHLDSNGFKLTRSKSNPLLYTYEINLICLRKTTDVNPSMNIDIKDGAIINSAGTTTSLGGYTGTNSGTNSGTSSSLKKNTSKLPASVLESKMTDKSLSSSASSSKKTIKNITSSSAKAVNSGTSISGSYIYMGGLRGSVASGYLTTFADEPLKDLDFEFNPTISILGREFHEDVMKGKIKSFVFNHKDSGFSQRLHDFLNSYIDNDIKTVVKACCIELIAIGINTIDDEFKRKMTKTDMERLISNMAYMIDLLGDLNKPNWELIKDFRMLQRCVMTIYNSGIYDEDIVEELSQIENAQKVGDE